MEHTATAERLSKHDLKRTDLQFWCIIATAASTIFSGVALALGTLIVMKLHTMPGFLKGKCVLVEVVNMQWSAESTKYNIWHYAFPSSASASLILLLLVNIFLTLILDAHNRIGSTSLIWLLHSETGTKPTCNTNGRMISGTRSFGKNALSLAKEFPANDLRTLPWY